MKLVTVIGAVAFLLTPVSSRVAADDAELIVHNAKVVTVDAKFSVAEAIAVRDGKIAAVGTSAGSPEAEGAEDASDRCWRQDRAARIVR